MTTLLRSRKTSLDKILLLLCVGLRASTAQAGSADAVGAWGDNTYGQTTVPVAAQSGVKAIAAGNAHTVALKNDGSVVAWGWNEEGQTTVPAAAQSEVKAIAAGYAHTVALRNDGSVVAWGSNSLRQRSVPAVAQSEVIAIAAGGYHSVALKHDGSVVAWGYNGEGQTTVPAAARSGVIAVAAGLHHTLALKSDGSVVAWGNNGYGQRTVPAAARSGVTAIAAGSYHTVALKDDGSVVAWGAGKKDTGIDLAYGQALVPLGAQNGITAIAAGGAYTVALKNDGTVVAWGQNDAGQTTVPAGLSGVTAIAAGAQHTVALVIASASAITIPPVSQTVHNWQSASFTVTATGYPLNYQWRRDGIDINGAIGPTYNLAPGQTNQAGGYTVVVSNSAGSVTSAPPALLTFFPAAPGAVGAWGDNGYGQTTVPVAAWSGVAAIAAGGQHSVALKTDGSVLAWGNNEGGQTDVPAGAQSGVTAIAAGQHHTVVLKDDGSVLGWGYIGWGPPFVVPVAAQSGVTAIAAGWQHTVALKYDASVVSWGYYDAPVPAAAQSGVTAIAAGANHSVALKGDGSVIAWGSNEFGQTTVPFAAQRGVVAIAAGANHSVALKSDGSVLAWGNNRSGQVTGIAPADEPYSATASPVVLGGQVVRGVIAIAAGEEHTVALKADGSVMVWGWASVPPGLNGVTAISAGGAHTLVLVLPTAPAITVQPRSQTVPAGQNASFTVTATGYPLSYQWRKDGLDIIGATGATYNLLPLQTDQTGSYTVVVSNSAGSVTSAPPAVLTVSRPVSHSVGAWGDDTYGQATVPAAAWSSVRAISAGGNHSVALKSDDSVVPWGTTDFDLTTAFPLPQSGMIATASGAWHTVALKNDGSVETWGDDNYGLLTVPVGAQSGVTAIAAGLAHSVALKKDGSVLAWGRSDEGQTMVPPAAQSGVTAIATGSLHTMALKSDGSVVAWGDDSFGQRNVPVAAQSGVTAIAAGGGHLLALKNDGTVVAWGENASGQTDVPAAAQGWITAIAAGDAHTVVLAVATAPIVTTPPMSQTVHAWQSSTFTITATGFPLYYQWQKDGIDIVGATGATYRIPFAQTNQAGSYSVRVSNAAGSVTHPLPAVLAVNPVAAPGTVVAWGAGVSSSGRSPNYGQSLVPVQAQAGIIAVAAGASHTLALAAGGSVMAWGDNLWGQATVPVAAQSGVKAIAAQENYNVALKTDGSVVAWGSNSYLQTNVPAGLNEVTSIAAGGFHVVALKVDGTLVAWGRNDAGETTGRPTTTGTYPPSAIANPVTLNGQLLSGVTAIAAGVDFTLALKQDGSVVAWGGPGYGQTTVPLAAANGVTAIAAGSQHSVALKADGTVVAWGQNLYGQTTGTPTKGLPYSAIADPVTLNGAILTGVTAVAAGTSHTVALKSDGTVVVWGSNDSGQTTVPSGLRGVTAISAGGQHTVALIGTGLAMPMSLNSQRSSSGLILSWPGDLVGFALQSASSLTPPIVWVDSPKVAAGLGGQFTVTNTTSGNAQFYRLKQPDRIPSSPTR